jgi:hypothetical protein
MISTATHGEARQLCDAVAVNLTVNTAEAAVLLGLAPQTLRRWACYGSGPVRPSHVNGRLRWPVQAIRDALAGTTVAV